MEVTRIFDLLDRYAEHFRRTDVLAGKHDGVWRKYTYNDYIRLSNLVSYGLMELGYQKGDKIATISNNRPEWNFADMGMMQIGVVHVPVYPTISSDEYRHILSHSGVKAAIISDKTLYHKLRKVLDTLDINIQLYTFNGVEDAIPWQQVIDVGQANKDKHREKLQEIKEAISPDDLATIIYTSGTTGQAKGVMLSHQNIVSNFIATAKLQPLDERHKVLSFLPLCHIYERMMNYHFQYKGIGIYYAEGLGTITADLVEVRADGFNTVPRLLEKVYDRIISKGKDLSGIKKKIFFWALNLGLRYELNGKNGLRYELKRKIADRLIYSKWRAALGGRVKIIVSGGSALQPRLSRLFWAAGMRIMEGYGLTETSPVIAVSHAEYPNLKFGTVGPVLEDIEVKIAPDGEILTKGPNLMMGYYKDLEYTRQVIDEDGWFHTGDIGVLDEGKFLKITDRKKEIFKLSSGKYVAPQLIENMFKESSFIEQIMVVGENEKFASALISPNFNYLHFWALKHKLHYRDNRDLVSQPEVISRVQKEVDITNQRLGAHEQIKRFRLVCEEWTPQSGFLSQTLKLRRAVIYRHYDALLRKIYNYHGNGEKG
jgi:long-chain acyl-CoA synthetase